MGSTLSAACCGTSETPRLKLLPAHHMRCKFVCGRACPTCPEFAKHASDVLFIWQSPPLFFSHLAMATLLFRADSLQVSACAGSWCRAVPQAADWVQ